MIFRTPPRKRRGEEVDTAVHYSDSPSSDRGLVLYEDPLPVSSQAQHSEQMLCTYQCRQMVKSEFLDSLSTAEKLAHEYQSKMEAMSNDLYKAEAERRKLQEQLNSLDQDLAAAKGREKTMQDQLMKELHDYHEQQEKQMKFYSDLEVKLKKEVNLRMTAESSSASAGEKAALLEEKLQRLSDSMEKEKKHLQNEILSVQTDSQLSLSKTMANLERMTCRANNAEEEVELLKKQLGELQDKLNECVHQKNDSERKLATLTAPLQDSSSNQATMLVKHLQEELKSYEAEVREARKLKASHVNIEMLKEKLYEEKSRRERAEAELAKQQEIQLNVIKLEEELMSWKCMAKGIPDISSCEDIPKKISNLQKEVIEGLTKTGELGARVKELEVALEVAELGKQHAEIEGQLAKGKEEESKLQVKRFELMLSSLSEERDRLLKEVITCKKQKGGETDTGEINSSLITELESSLSERENAIKKLEENINQQMEVISRQHDELKFLTLKLNNEERKIKSLEREGDRLRSEIFLLETKLGHGDYSSASTKVLRMVNTLGMDNEAKLTIEALRSELQKLQAKLQAIEDLKEHINDGNLNDSDISEKLSQLKAQIATLEKREERYKAVFAEKISVFRRACCALFGYKIVMDDQQGSNGIPVTRFILQSIYAQSDEEKLEFEYESGNMNVLVNDYSSQPEISHQVEIFVRKMNSIPAFTANLTVESFNRRTLS